MGQYFSSAQYSCLYTLCTLSQVYYFDFLLVLLISDSTVGGPQLKEDTTIGGASWWQQGQDKCFQNYFLV